MRSRWVVVAAGGCAVLLTAVAVAGWVVQRLSLTEALDAFVVSNLVIGAGFGACGALIAWFRPQHPVGWLYLVGGNCQLLTAACATLGMAAVDHGSPDWLLRLLATLFSAAWPINIGVAVPLSLMLLPDGRLPSPRWRPWFWLAAATSPLFVLEQLTVSTDGTTPTGYLALPVDGGWAVLWTASEVRWVLSMLLGVTALVVRYVRGDETVRRRLLWIVLGAGTVLVAVTPWALVAGTPLAVLFAIPLLPAGITVAVLRHGLLDVRLVLARGVAYLLLSSLVLAGYAVLVLVLSGVTSALLVAMLALPVRAWLQTWVERVLYGHRNDPARVAAQVGGALHDLTSALTAVRTSLRLPYVAVRDGAGALVAESGAATAQVTRLPLDTGVLEIAPRSGEQRLSTADERLITMLSGPIAVAVSASTTAAQLQQSRELLVTAREEERRRLRHDLHDGLGTLLTGVVLAADAAGNVAATQPEHARDLLDSVRKDLRAAVAEVRRLVDGLRPLPVDELGLVAALEIRAAQTLYRADGGPLEVTVHADLDGPLPAALEVAAYRIATEALTNVVRHAHATRAAVTLCAKGGILEVAVHDDGRSTTWGTGVGTTSMRERAEELGGRCEHGPGPDGGTVRALIPIAGSA